MRKPSIFRFGIMIVFGLGFCALPAQAKYSGGRGTATEPFLIDTAEQMNTLGGESTDWGRHFKLIADIDFGGSTGAQFNFIGYGANPFSGVFDGNGHSIHDFEPLDSCSSYMSGLFGEISSKGEVRNLTLVNPRVRCLSSSDYFFGGLLVGGLYGRVTNCHVVGGYIEKYFPPWPRNGTYGNIGGLIGSMHKDAVVSECSVTDTSIRGDGAGGILGGDGYGTIQDCTVINVDINGGYHTGGIVARVLGTVERCSATGIIRAEAYAGGIVGVVSGGPADSPFYPVVRECYASCIVSSDDNAGGLAGAASNKCLIIDCYATGSVGGQAHTGGLVSCLRNYHGVAPQVVNCYAAASLSGSNRGGLINHTHLDGGPVEVVNSFWDIEASTVIYSAGGTGKTTEQMERKDTFTSAGWDFTAPIWYICGGPSYPKLWWEECPPPQIIYVDGDASGSNSGSNWVDAFNDLQDALSAARYGDEIRVAQGVYKPAVYIPPPPPPPFPPPPGYSNGGETAAVAFGREVTFQLVNGVVIKGGYAGFDEPDPNARDIDTYETILSGDLAGNDEPNFVNYEENSYHVVTGSDTDETAVLDGFTITAGNANGFVNPDDSGGGMYNMTGSPTLANCTFTGNSAVRDGGGMFNSEQSNPTLTNCTFTGNLTIYDGGAMCNRTSSPTVTNCTFSGNLANHGGGISNWLGSPTVRNCTFTGNSTELGGAVFNWDSSPILTNCIFSNNSAREWGGAICNLNASSPMLSNCTFSGNRAGDSGNAMNNRGNSSPTVTNCIFWDGGGEISNDDHWFIMITYSDVQGGWHGTGNINVNPLFVDAGSDNYHLLADSPCINAGDPNYVAEPNETDLDGRSRIIYGRIDMGAYEYFNTPPVADAGHDQTVEAQASWGATVTLDGSGSGDADSSPGTNDDIRDFNWYKVDPCDSNTNILLGSGEILDCNLPLGEHIIVLEVIDEAGAFDADEVTIIVQDTTPPIFTNIPQDLILECDGSYNEAELNGWLGSAAAVDECGSVTMTNNFVGLLNGCGATGSATVIWTAKDESGNTATTPAAILTIVDTTPPDIICPADVTLECPADTSVEANGSATADDTCSSVIITHSDVWQPGCGNTGTLVRTWTATDECGNGSTCVQTITVVDTTPPEFEFSVTPTVLWPANHKMVKITPLWTVSDKCDATPDVSLVSISVNEADDAKGAGNTSDDIQIGDDGSIYLRAERSGTSNDRIYIITYRAVDDCGNATESSATVTVPHDQR